MVRYVIPRIWAKFFLHPCLEPGKQIQRGEIEMQGAKRKEGWMDRGKKKKKEQRGDGGKRREKERQR